ncbi:Dpy30 domain-containing protein 2 [Plakobranchus ocellatus]|uniref:Dpy30 domain-containing protein 2 n=1 Tax=Plakobranchus ocellatus TaxID=259542 RepID=A0AAV3XYQ6_9GAST|nr:Dpy30 domain-containing protein 2 [Plakobranchus ocellatus]
MTESILSASSQGLPPVPTPPSGLLASLEQSFSQLLVCEETSADQKPLRSHHGVKGREADRQKPAISDAAYADQLEGPTAPATHYLASLLGGILARCMAEVCEHRPQDPIEYTSRWLYRYADSQVYMQEKALFLQNVKVVADIRRREWSARLNRMQLMLKQFEEQKKLMSQISPKECKKFVLSPSCTKGAHVQWKHSKNEESLQQLLASSAAPEVEDMWLNFKPPEGFRVDDFRKSGFRYRLLGEKADEYAKRYSTIYSDSTASTRKSSALQGRDRRRWSTESIASTKALDSDIYDRESTRISVEKEKGQIADGYLPSDQLSLGYRSGVKAIAEKQQVIRLTSEGYKVVGEESLASSSSLYTQGQKRMSTKTSERFSEQRRRLKGGLGTIKGSALDRLGLTDSTKAYWKYEYPPGRLVCVHPLLGEMAASSPSVCHHNPQLWRGEEFSCQSRYDDELYACLSASLLYFSPEHTSPREAEQTTH